jgi:hypothetical protein
MITEGGFQDAACRGDALEVILAHVLIPLQPSGQ